MLINLSPAVRAALWMIGTVVSFSAMAVGGRELSGDLTTFQILFHRSIVGLVVVSVLLSATGWRQLRVRRFSLHLLRNVLHLGGQFGWFFAISVIPLAEVFAIEFTTPMWAAILAMLFLGERPRRTSLAAIGLGFVGILIILRPGFQEIGIPTLGVLGAAMAYATTYVLTKYLGQTDSPLAIIFYMTVIQLPIALAASLALHPADSHWAWPELGLWPWIVVVGVTALTAHYCAARALSLADATVVVPIDFLRLPLIALVGLALYGETIDIWVIVGGVVIFAGTFLNVRSAAAVAVAEAKNGTEA